MVAYKNLLLPNCLLSKNWLPVGSAGLRTYEEKHFGHIDNFPEKGLRTRPFVPTPKN